MNFDVYPDSYQNDMIYEILADFYNDIKFKYELVPANYDKLTNHLTKLLEECDLKIGFIPVNDENGYTTNEISNISPKFSV